MSPPFYQGQGLPRGPATTGPHLYALRVASEAYALNLSTNRKYVKHNSRPECKVGSQVAGTQWVRTREIVRGWGASGRRKWTDEHGLRGVELVGLPFRYGLVRLEVMQRRLG